MYKISKTSVNEIDYELLCPSVYKVYFRENIKKVIKNYTYNEYTTLIKYNEGDVLQYIQDNKTILLERAQKEEEIQSVADKIATYQTKLVKYNQQFVNLYQDYVNGDATETELKLLLKTITTLQSSIDEKEVELTNL